MTPHPHNQPAHCQCADPITSGLNLRTGQPMCGVCDRPIVWTQADSDALANVQITTRTIHGPHAEGDAAGAVQDLLHELAAAQDSRNHWRAAALALAGLMLALIAAHALGWV